jgi:hypothetical protein
VLSSGAQSRRGRIITRMATTDTDQIPITDRPAAACGTATPGCQLASYELTAGGFVVEANEAAPGVHPAKTTNDSAALVCRRFATTLYKS